MPWDKSDAMDVKSSSSGMACGVRVATISLGQGRVQDNTRQDALSRQKSWKSVRDGKNLPVIRA
jgi:hypothetical protein